jgi:D-glycero-D-manno-heptose 1,7-bisphosphate phosphatase
MGERSRQVSTPAVFLDRDGVITRPVIIDGRPRAPWTMEEFEVLADAVHVLPALKAAGFDLIVVTNQPDVARGWVAKDLVETMHRRLMELLPIDEIRACFEIDGPASRCYKPAPGMLMDAARNRGLDLKASYMIGDRWRDIGAGRAAGCTTIFIDYGYRERQPDSPDYVVSTVKEAGHLILGML